MRSQRSFMAVPFSSSLRQCSMTHRSWKDSWRNVLCRRWRLFLKNWKPLSWVSAPAAWKIPLWSNAGISVKLTMSNLNSTGLSEMFYWNFWIKTETVNPSMNSMTGSWGYPMRDLWILKTVSELRLEKKKVKRFSAWSARRKSIF